MQAVISKSHFTVVQPSGAIDASHAAELQDRLLKASVAATRPAVLLLDFSEVHHMDREGLMALVRTLKLARTLGQRLILCSVSASIRIILELCQLDRVLEIYENRVVAEREAA